MSGDSLLPSTIEILAEVSHHMHVLGHVMADDNADEQLQQLHREKEGMFNQWFSRESPTSGWADNIGDAMLQVTEMIIHHGLELQGAVLSSRQVAEETAGMDPQDLTPEHREVMADIPVTMQRCEENLENALVMLRQLQENRLYSLEDAMSRRGVATYLMGQLSTLLDERNYDTCRIELGKNPASFTVEIAGMHVKVSVQPS